MGEIYNKDYCWENIWDVEEDISCAIDKLGCKFKGTVNVVVTYTEDKDVNKD